MGSISWQIAWRYLIGKKSNNAINLITWISILGIAIGTAALILILSVFNGFKAMLSDMFDAFNPDLKVTLVEGKVFEIDSTQAKALQDVPGIAEIARSIEEVALFEYDDTQKIGIIKGVDDHYATVTDIDTTMVSGTFVTREGSINYGVVGMGLSNMLDINHRDALTPITVYMLLRKSRGPLSKEFKSKELYPSGVFSVKGEADLRYIVTSYDFVNRLLDYRNQNSALELRLAPGADEGAVRAGIAEVLGEGYHIANKYEQNETFLKIMNIEKWVSYLITSLTLLLIAFNLVGSLWMIVLDKKKDIAILRSMGMESKDVEVIFRRLGLLITTMGLLIGLVLAIVLFILQKEVGLLRIPDGFMMTAYPIALNIWDFVVVPITVLLIGLGAAWLPSKKAGQVRSSLR